MNPATAKGQTWFAKLRGVISHPRVEKFRNWIRQPWFAIFWNFIYPTGKALGLLFLRLVILLFLIQGLAFLPVLLYLCLIRPRFGIPLNEKDLISAFETLTDWTWKTGILGTFAIWLTERMKWQEKLSGLRDELDESTRNQYWDKLERIHKDYSDLRNKNPDARDKRMEEQLANGLYQKIMRELDADWSQVSSQVQTILNLMPNHARAATLNRVLTKDKQAFDEEDLTFLEDKDIAPEQARALIVHLLKEHRRSLPA